MSERLPVSQESSFDPKAAFAALLVAGILQAAVHSEEVSSLIQAAERNTANLEANISSFNLPTLNLLDDSK